MVPLHVHSNYSLLTGAASIDGLIAYAKREGLKALALTDTNGMYGLIRFAKKCGQAGIKPILGAQIDEPGHPNITAVFLAKNNEGYSELCRLITSRKLNDGFSLAEVINKSSQNLFILVSSLELLSRVQPCGNIYVELYSASAGKKQTRRLYEFAVKNKMKFVATNPIYFLEPEDFLIHQILTSIRLKIKLENLREADLVSKECYWKKMSELTLQWKNLPDAVSASDYIADNCNVDLHFGEYKYPKFPFPGGQDAKSFLWSEAYKGLKENFIPLTQNALDRLRYELSEIRELNLTDYFLIVWDIVKEARRRGMMVIGRGSAANSIVAYCLGLTQVDPIKNNLYFERFLNKGRSNPPDVDIDFSWKERDEITKYVFKKYGYENVAMISTTVTFRARSAFREVSKAYGFTNEEISMYSKYMPWSNTASLPDRPEIYSESKSFNFKKEPWKSIVETASRIANFPRHLSIHPSGIIITPERVTNYAALEYASNKGLGLIITQPDMYSIEDIGLIKIDLLSQRSLGVLRDTINRIRINYNN